MRPEVLHGGKLQKKTRYLNPLFTHFAAPRCNITTQSGGVELLTPKNETSIARGAVVRYACRDGYSLTKGQLTLACGTDGQLIGQTPVCTGKFCLFVEN